MITFDTARKHIVLDSTSVSAETVWSRWVDWHAANAAWLLTLTQEGGALVDPVLGIYSPRYFFLENGWRIRPMEADHDLSMVGNLVVRGGGTPVVRTLGAYQVNVQYVVPERAQGIITSGSSGPSAADIAAAVMAAAQASPIWADTRRMNGSQVLGDGTEPNKWRGGV